MKFSVKQEQLLDALQRVQSVVEKKNTVQILANILCTVKDQTLSLCATDLEVGIKLTIPVESAEDGRITLSARHFLEIVKELPNKPIWVNKKGNDWVEMICGKSRFNVVSLSADEFPSLPEFEEKSYLNARAEALIEMIDKTAFAVSTDATRYHMNGVFFEHLENNVMRMVACDGHRLSFVNKEIFEQMPQFNRGIIIPRKGLGELRKLLDLGHETIGLAFDRGYLYAKAGDVYAFIRLIDGEYPDYKPVIPKSVDRVAKIRTESFMAALRRVSLLAHEKSKGVKLKLSENMLQISSSNPDKGEAMEELDDLEYRGEPSEISFNARYLLEYLPTVQSDTLEFHFKERLTPGIFYGSDSKNHTYVIMPMRL